MATCNYNKKTRTFTVIWKDYAKEALGEKYPYSRKSEKWQGVKPPSASERRAVEKRLMTLAEDEEYKSKGKADYIRTHGNDEAITASGYLTNLQEDELSRTSRQGEKKEARRIINDFVTWLDGKHKGIALHKINEVIATQFYKHLEQKGITLGTIQKYKTRLSYIFKRVIRKYEDSPLKYKNPFSTLSLGDAITPQAPHKRKPYTEAELQDFLHHSKTSKKLNKWQILQRFAIFYFMTVTGWRIGDILTLTREQIDLQKGIIKLTHSKTKERDLKTELYITDLMSEILTALYLMKDKAPNEYKHLVFSMRKGGSPSAWYNSIKTHFDDTRAKLKLDEYEQKGKVKTYTYTLHSFRHTVITRLTQAGYQEAKINYLVGHAPKTTEEKTYLTLEAKDTKELIQHMENLAKTQYFFEKLELAKELYKSDLYLDLLAKRAKRKQEPKKQFDNERFIPLP